LDEVRAKVEDSLKASKAAELAKAKAQEFAEKAKDSWRTRESGKKLFR
jgi:uncharacterized protein YjbJ (UPF0337 family)